MTRCSGTFGASRAELGSRVSGPPPHTHPDPRWMRCPASRQPRCSLSCAVSPSAPLICSAVRNPSEVTQPWRYRVSGLFDFVGRKVCPEGGGGRGSRVFVARWMFLAGGGGGEGGRRRKGGREVGGGRVGRSTLNCEDAKCFMLRVRWQLHPTDGDFTACNPIR